MPETTKIKPQPGPVVLFGSGETSPSGRKVFDQVLKEMEASPRLALLETPAGFEPNSDYVIDRVADFIRHRLRNYSPQVIAVPARKRGTPFSPDDPETVAPILEADMIFMGPGSPTYAVRQLRDSLAWDYTLARHRLGAALVLASAATIAVSAFALPVYEIYKVGDDLHWVDGLDFFGLYGMPLVFIPHWNNNDGGEVLDTSRCFMGQARFAELMEALPSELTVLGIDEMTALIMDLEAMTCSVTGQGGVTLIHKGPLRSYPDTDVSESGLAEVAEKRRGHVHQFQSGETFPLERFYPFKPPEAGEGLPGGVWELALEVAEGMAAKDHAVAGSPPPREVVELAERRQEAREKKDWAAADELRERIVEMGWEVTDTPRGSSLKPGG